MAANMAGKKVTVLALQEKKERGEPISMVTAYDYPGALAAERAGIDTILVGDSLAMVVLGHESTVPVTMDEMLHHCRAVRRGAQAPYLIGDMPFMSYQADRAEAIRNAGRFLKEAGMDADQARGRRRGAATVRGHHRCRHRRRRPYRSHAPIGGKVGRLPGAGAQRRRRPQAAPTMPRRWRLPAPS